MKRYRILFSVLAISVMSGCATTQQVDPNYRFQLDTMEKIYDKKLAYITQAADVCKQSKEPGLCIAVVANGLGNNKANIQSVPTYNKPGSTASNMLLGILSKAIPAYMSIEINKDNNKTRAEITRSSNDMISTIFTSATNGFTTIGSVPTTQVGGDYIVGNDNGDGDRFGDNAVIGNDNGDGDRFGDNAVNGNDNGDGNRFGDNAVNGNDNGDGNRFGDNAVNGDNNGDDNSDNSSG